MTEKVKKLSLSDLNASARCANAFDMVYIDENGEETDFVIQVIGDQSPSVKKAIFNKINKKRAQEDFLKKKGKDVPLEDIEELIEDNIESLAACIVGWKGIVEEYSPELAVKLLANNKAVSEQVKAASENILNFTTSK